MGRHSKTSSSASPSSPETSEKRGPGRPPAPRPTPVDLTLEKAREVLERDSVMRRLAEGFELLRTADPEAAQKSLMSYARERGWLKDEPEAPLPVDPGSLIDRITKQLLHPGIRELLARRGIIVNVEGVAEDSEVIPQA